MSDIEPEPPDDLTPEQRHQRIIAILARAVMRRVRWLRISPPTESMLLQAPLISATISCS